jgi:hypothetical protein
MRRPAEPCTERRRRHGHAPAGAAMTATVTTMNPRDALLRITCALGALVGYGGLAAFLYLIGVQVYRWFREGDWTHFGMTEGLRLVLSPCVKDPDGRLAALIHWLDTPVDWLGLHKVLEVVPASLVLFAVSIMGNSLFIYCRDRIDERKRAR